MTDSDAREDPARRADGAIAITVEHPEPGDTPSTFAYYWRLPDGTLLPREAPDGGD